MRIIISSINLSCLCSLKWFIFFISSRFCFFINCSHRSKLDILLIFLIFFAFLANLVQVNVFSQRWIDIIELCHVFFELIRPFDDVLQVLLLLSILLFHLLPYFHVLWIHRTTLISIWTILSFLANFFSSW